MKSLSGASGGEGGYAVPREIDGAIAATLTSLSPIRGIATVVQTGTSGYRKLITTGATEAGWVGETAARPAAVLIAFTDRPNPGVILTQRPQWLRAHAGQVAFPGGKVDPGDRDVVDAETGRA